MRISDWSSDVCSSDLPLVLPLWPLESAAQLGAGHRRSINNRRRRAARTAPELSPPRRPCQDRPLHRGSRPGPYLKPPSLLQLIVDLQRAIYLAFACQYPHLRGSGEWRQRAAFLPLGVVSGAVARKSVVSGKSVSVRVDLGGRRHI